MYTRLFLYAYVHDVGQCMSISFIFVSRLKKGKPQSIHLVHCRDPSLLWARIWQCVRECMSECVRFLCVLLVTTIPLNFIQRLIGMKFLFRLFFIIFYFAAHTFQNENLCIQYAYTHTHMLECSTYRGLTIHFEQNSCCTAVLYVTVYHTLFLRTYIQIAIENLYQVNPRISGKKTIQKNKLTRERKGDYIKKNNKIKRTTTPTTHAHKRNDIDE